MDDKSKRIQAIRTEYTRKLDVLRKEQADIVTAFKMELEKRKKQEIMNKLNS